MTIDVDKAPFDPWRLNQAGKIELLSSMAIFQDLSPEQMESLDSSTRTITVDKGRVVFEPDTTGEGLFLLKSGKVQLYRLSPEGKKFILDTVGPGTFFGEMAFVGQGMYGAFAECIEPAAICVMSRHDLERLILEIPMVGIRFMETMAGRLDGAETRLEDLAFKSLAGRLASLLVRMAEPGSNEVAGLTHNDMAESVGTSRETATQALNDLKSRGLINIRRMRIEIIDMDGLIDVAETYLGGNASRFPQEVALPPPGRPNR